MIWPENIYSFTKPGKAIVTWKFVMKTEDGRAEYYCTRLSKSEIK